MRLSLLLAVLVSAAGTAPALADCAADIRDIMGRSITSGPYHIETTVVSAEGEMKMQGEVVPPAAMHMKSEVAGQHTEVIVIDGEGWMQMNGTWSALPAQIAGTMSQAFSPESVAALAGITEARCLGEQPFESGTVLAFSYAFSSADVTTANTLHADPVTRLPVRLESTADMAGTTAHTVATYRYDPAITLTPPVN